MSRPLLLLVLAAALLGAPGCFMRQTSNVDQAKNEGYVQFTGGTGEDQIFLDGKAVGSGSDYSVDRLLAVTPGPHLVEVRHAGSVIRQERVYVGTGSTRRFTIR